MYYLTESSKPRKWGVITSILSKNDKVTFKPPKRWQWTWDFALHHSALLFCPLVTWGQARAHLPWTQPALHSIPGTASKCQHPGGPQIWTSRCWWSPRWQFHPSAPLGRTEESEYTVRCLNSTCRSCSKPRKVRHLQWDPTEEWCRTGRQKPAATEEPPRHHQATKIQNTTSTQYLREMESFKHYSVHVYK